MNALPESCRRQIQLTKIEYLDWVLDELLRGYKVPDRDVERAMKYVEDIREDYKQGVNRYA
jgi:hypothetical protein